MDTANPSSLLRQGRTFGISAAPSLNLPRCPIPWLQLLQDAHGTGEHTAHPKLIKDVTLIPLLDEIKSLHGHLHSEENRTDE